MKAFVLHKIGSVGVLEKAIPTIGPNDAFVRTTAVRGNAAIARGLAGSAG
jgi:hypothetical protein